MPSVSNFQTALEGVLITQITAAATTATVRVKEINGVTPTWLTTAHRITIIQKDRTATKVEVVDVAAGTTQSGSTVTLGTMTRGLPLDGSGFTGTGTAQVFRSGAKVIVTWDAQAGRQTAFKDLANTFSDHQTISGTNELRFNSSATAVWKNADGDLSFKDANNATKTLSDLAAAAGSDEKVAISANDTTPDYLVNKITGGDGVTVTETGDGGDETLDIDLDLATDPGLEISSGALRVKVKASGGVTRDSDGLSITDGVIGTQTTLLPDNAAQKSAAAGTLAPGYLTAVTGSGTTTALTTSLTNNGNLVAVGFHINSGTDDVVSVTYGGQAMTQMDKYNGTPSSESNYLYILHNAPQGANDVVITLNASRSIVMVAGAYYYFSTAAAPTVKNKGTGSGSASAAVTTTVDNSWLIGWGRSAGGTCSAGANTTKRAGSEQGLFDTNGPETPAGSFSLACSGTGTNVMIVAAVEPPGIIDSLDFDASTEEYADFTFTLPPNYTAGQTIDVVINWASTSTTGDVVWGVKGVGMSDGDVVGNTFGTEVTQSDTLQVAKVCKTTVSAVTLGGSAVAGDYATLRISRKAASGSDTLGSDASLLSIQILY